MADTASSPILNTTANDGFISRTSTTPTLNQTFEALKDITVGSIAGGIGKVVEYPFDTVKVRLQSQSSLRYAGPLDCFRQSFHTEGIAGLYRGISAPLTGAAIETGSLFFSYRIAQELYRTYIPTNINEKQQETRGNLPLSALAACGAASGAFTSLLLTPIELVKCQMQVPPSSSSPAFARPGPLSIISSIFKHNGIFGFWHGQLGTLIRETGGSAAWFGSYEGVSAMFRKYNIASTNTSTVTPLSDTASTASLPLHHQLLAGAAAGVTYNFAFFPADTIKSRMQTAEVGSNAVAGRKNATFWASGKALWESQGLKGMYRGCGITVVRSAPSSAIIFAIYEGLRGWWG